jgi:alkylmercury lyase
MMKAGAADGEDTMSVAQDVCTIDTRNAFADYLKRRVLTTNTPETQRLSIALYRLLARGVPAGQKQLAAACNLSQDHVESFLRKFFPSAVVFDDRCAVIAFSGLSLAPTHHLFIMDEAKLYTWCAFDALFLPEILRKPAALITQCPGSGAELTVQLAPGQVRAAPPGCVVSIVMPGTKSCRDNLRKAFCDHVNLFKDEQTFMIWSKGRQDVRCVTLGEAEVFARQRNALRYPDLDLSALPQSW